MDQESRRRELQTLLEEILGSFNVYFQPPINIELVFPCIIYKRNNARTQFAGNYPYRYTLQYQVMVVDEDPDSGILDKIAEMPMCTFERHYTADRLNHDIFNIFF